MNCIQKLIDDTNRTDGPFLVSIRTVDGDVHSGMLGHTDERTVVLHPPETPESPVETDLVMVTYFNVANIVSAWAHD